MDVDWFNNFYQITDRSLTLFINRCLLFLCLLAQVLGSGGRQSKVERGLSPSF